MSAHDQEKLRDLTSQSWNMELAISGVAMFAILQLPELLDVLFDSFQYNFKTQTEGMQGLLPSLAYSMIRATGNVLFLAFLINFVMRAYWVGLVGLLAVYPSGIQYDRLPFMSQFAKAKLADDFGSLDGYILRLDRRCNIVFALAFQFVFLFIFLGLMYLMTLLVYSVLRPLLPPPAWEVVKIGGAVLLVVYVGMSLVLSNKKVMEHPTGTKFHYRYMKFNQYLMMGLHKPSSYISNTFYSNLPQKSVIRTMVVAMSLFMVAFIVEYLNDISRTNPRVSFFNRRHLYSARVDSLFVNTSVYDNLRDVSGYVDVAAIQADVIREPYIRLFIAYPKALDTLFTRVAKEPVLSDILSRQEIRERLAVWRNREVNRLLQITVNDSLYAQPDLLFSQPGELQQRGFQTVLVPSNLRTGKNMLRVRVVSGSPEKTREMIAIPFWYVPEK
ncbi:hypothetical protein F5984_14750 [Rudanella paleaurantiibacter]|uniref:Uncharacterized protein n=2 Tax=Rudanella paleaurantiibacter TaxID=2614655 RepID=A0A7J5TZM6_9BACT|nr:hypothetical protein F5984_14750 [Rudanella paleaurantiibacter]